MIKLFLSILAVPILVLILHISVLADTRPQFKLASDLEWKPLNPARGDKSPMAATLWGDRHGAVATGFLVKFVDGFSSPPHIHNVSYRGLVIEGHIHNDDPSASKMWMPRGSFWTQPAGEIHITAAKGDYNLAYIEIDNGPYLVWPTDDSFDNGERPVNVDESNIVWIKQDKTLGSDDIELAYLWGTPRNNQSYGALINIPVGLTIDINNDGTMFHAVVIDGRIDYQISKDSTQEMMPGSYFSNIKGSSSTIYANEDSVIYVRANGMFNITQE